MTATQGRLQTVSYLNLSDCYKMMITIINLMIKSYNDDDHYMRLIIMTSTQSRRLVIRQSDHHKMMMVMIKS